MKNIITLAATVLITCCAWSQENSPCLENSGTPNPWPSSSASDGGYIVLGNLGQQSQFSVSMWVKASSEPHGHSILLDCSHGGSSNWVIQSLDYGATWGFLGITFSLEANVWKHLLCTYNNGVAKVFINGTLVGQSNYTISWSGTQNLYLGNWPEGGRRFTGSVDEVLVTRNVLYDENFSAPLRYEASDVPANSLGHWHFDEASGTTTVNAVTNTTVALNSWTWTTRDAGNNSGGGSTTPESAVTETGVPGYAPGSGLVAWWLFNGDANDASDNNNDGQVSSAVVSTDRWGRTSGAYRFNGGGNQIVVPGSQSLNNIESVDKLSVSAWFRIKSYEWFPLLNKHHATDDSKGWEILLSSSFGGAPYVDFPINSAATVACNPSFGHDTWVHLVLTYDRQQQLALLYINGEEACRKTMSNDLTTTNNGNLYIGASLMGSDESCNGNIDDLGIWNRALKTSEVASLYESLTFTTQPATPAVAGGQSCVLTAGASTTTGVAVSYQWQRSDGGVYVNLSNGSEYSGVTTQTLTISSAKVSKSGPYRCVATTANASAYSAAVSLNVTCPCNQ